MERVQPCQLYRWPVGIFRTRLRRYDLHVFAARHASIVDNQLHPVMLPRLEIVEAAQIDGPGLSDQYACVHMVCKAYIGLCRINFADIDQIIVFVECGLAIQDDLLAAGMYAAGRAYPVFVPHVEERDGGHAAVARVHEEVAGAAARSAFSRSVWHTVNACGAYWL